MASTLFTGTSRYSQDFSAVIERQVGIASLRLTQMQQNRSKSNEEITALQLVEDGIDSLRSTLQSIEDGLVSKTWQTTSTDTGILTASSTAGAAAGSYTVRVMGLGAYANSASTGTVADPASGDFVTAGTTSLALSIKNVDSGVTAADVSITLTGTTLQAVADSINNTASAGVSAAIVNIGSTSSPRYALSLQSKTYGKLALQLRNDVTNLMTIPGDTDAALGSLVEYKVNGTTVKSDSRTITLAPRVTADLLSADNTKDVTVTVSQSTTSFEDAFKKFVAAYNQTLNEMEKYTGAKGILAGNALVSSLRSQMRSAITGVTGSGSLDSMAKIGVEFGKDGHLTFNTSLFRKETEGKLSDLQALIGTAATPGFMKVATGALNSIADGKGGGMLTGTVSSLEASLEAEDERIEAEQARVARFSKDLQERLVKADAMIAQLEQQATYFNSMFEAMRVNQKSMS